jgi:hypothetical protein
MEAIVELRGLSPQVLKLRGMGEGVIVGCHSATGV